MKKRFFIAISLIATLSLVYSCGNNSDSSADTADSTSVVDSVVIDNSEQEPGADVEFISYFDNGQNVFVKIYSNKEKLSLFDADRKLVTSGQIADNTNDILTYNMDNGSVVMVSLQQPNMTIKNGEEDKSLVLISPSQELYISADKKDSIKAVYRPEESVTLETKDAALVLKQKSAWSKGAEYVCENDSTILWSTQMNKATLTKEGKKVKYTTDGKSKLPESYFK